MGGCAEMLEAAGGRGRASGRGEVASGAPQATSRRLPSPPARCGHRNRPSARTTLSPAAARERLGNGKRDPLSSRSGLAIAAAAGGRVMPAGILPQLGVTARGAGAVQPRLLSALALASRSPAGSRSCEAVPPCRGPGSRCGCGMNGQGCCGKRLPGGNGAKARPGRGGSIPRGGSRGDARAARSQQLWP